MKTVFGHLKELALLLVQSEVKPKPVETKFAHVFLCFASATYELL